MCEICSAEGKDYRFLNGKKDQVVTQQLYKVFKNNVAAVRLCYVHGIELFMLGEKRFLKEHILFARALGSRSRKLSSINESPFGF